MSSPPLPSIDFAVLFRDPRMFDSKEKFIAAGFEVRKTSSHNIMVGSHRSAPDHLFKKYSRDVSPGAQLENYQSRLEGARKLRSFVEEQRLRHIVVPQKWIYDLPPGFAYHGRSPHLLVVERMSILKTKEVERCYRDIDDDVLEELCRVLHKFKGLDAAPHNAMFTSSGQIAFIDTENWNRPSHREDFFRHIERALSDDSRRRARRIFQKLGDNGRHGVKLHASHRLLKDSGTELRRRR